MQSGVTIMQCALPGGESRRSHVIVPQTLLPYCFVKPDTMGEREYISRTGAALRRTIVIHRSRCSNEKARDHDNYVG